MDGADSLFFFGIGNIKIKEDFFSRRYIDVVSLCVTLQKSQIFWSQISIPQDQQKEKNSLMCTFSRILASTRGLKKKKTRWSAYMVLSPCGTRGQKNTEKAGIYILLFWLISLDGPVAWSGI